MDFMSRTAERISHDCLSSGVMPKFFIVTGPSHERELFVDALKGRGLEPLESGLEGERAIPQAIHSHEGSHFNRKLYILTVPADEAGPDWELVAKLNQFRGVLNKTALWVVLWLSRDETVPWLSEFRERFPGLWRTANGCFVRLFPTDLDSLHWKKKGKSFSLETSLGRLPIPESIASKTLDDVLKDTSTDYFRFWSDLLHLSAADILVSMLGILAGNIEVGLDVIQIVNRLVRDLQMKDVVERFAAREDLKEALSANVKEINEGGSWIFEAERVLQEADRKYQGGDPNGAIETLNRVLDGENGWIDRGANLLVDRPIRLRAILRRSVGRISDASSDIDRWERMALNSGLDAPIASAYRARALHFQDLGDGRQAEKWLAEAGKLNRSDR